jgi:hypothetical protein
MGVDYDFELLPLDDHHILNLSTLHTAICEIEGARQWVEEGGSIFSHDEICSLISCHSAVLEMGHSGPSIGWSFRTLKKIYELGIKECCERM